MSTDRETANERFERMAEAFHRETGFTAPGKDVPAELGADDYEARVKAWREWRAAGAAQWATPSLETPRHD